VPDAASNPSLNPPKPQRGTIVPAGLLLLALAIVVIYTNGRAFRSPVALVVVAAIGMAALLLQLRLRRDLANPVRSPLWLNMLGVLFAVAAVFADALHFSATRLMIAALGAVGCFALSGIIVLDALRKQRR
jgi:drug/metabolite transporter (DMT)-like permease